MIDGQEAKRKAKES